MKTLKFGLVVAVIMVTILAFKVGGIIGILMGVAAVDLLCTVFGRPLLKPGPLAKFLYNLDKQQIKTFLKQEISDSTRGILYLCKYDYSNYTIKVVREIQFDSSFDALQSYANIPNPESQVALGKDKEAFEKELEQLHTRLNNPEWVKDLVNYL